MTTGYEAAELDKKLCMDECVVSNYGRMSNKL